MAKKAKIEATPTKEKKQNSGKKETTRVKKETPITTEVKEEVKVEEETTVDEILGEYKPIEIKMDYEEPKEEKEIVEIKEDFPYSGDTNANDAVVVEGEETSEVGLHTARTLWGQSFDGTANVSGNMTEETKEDNEPHTEEDSTQEVENKKEEPVKEKPKKKKLSLAMFRSLFGFYWNGTTMD